MAALTGGNTRGVLALTSRMSESSGRVPTTGGAGRSAETWKRDIVRQLKHRDRNQHVMFQDVIRFYTQLLEKTSLTKGMLRWSDRRPSCNSGSCASSLFQLRKTAGELAYQVVELHQQIKIKECLLEEQHARMSIQEGQFIGVFDARRELQEQVMRVQGENRALKMQYDTLLQQQREAESSLRETKVRRLQEDMIHQKQQAAAHRNKERGSRAREANQQTELLTAVQLKDVDSSFTLNSRTACPKTEKQSKSPECGHARLVRSASVSSPRFLSSIKELFDRKRRAHSECSLEEDLMYPVGLCSARLPVRALQVLEAHDQGINAVRFSSTANLLATGGTDRLIKLWEVRSGSLIHRGTLGGSTEGITCVEFNNTGRRILAASYDTSALLWERDNAVPKLTLTGHSRKVTAARFSALPHQAVTGSADSTIRCWDLHRAACVQLFKVPSYCSDLVCCDSYIISGHFDCKIRVWDTRTVSCIQELPAQGKITSLDITSDHRQLLSCCRGDCLQLVDVRRWSHNCVCFRAEGFKCGSDSTKAVISPDGSFLAAGSANGVLYIWNASTGKLEAHLADSHSSSISAVSWSPSGDYVVSVDKSRLAVLWSDM